MRKIKILTLFPEVFSALNSSILGKASENGIIEIQAIDIREYSEDKHKKCDDYPFGGGAGMVMTPQPVFDAIEAADPLREFLRIFMSPRGSTLSPALIKSVAASDKDILILCGHYEGIDQRVIDLCIDIEISVGDYILTGGEIPAMVLIDAVCRYIPGVLGSIESANDESFSDGFLEYPQYTRPQVFKNIAVPEVLISGHHENIRKWRLEESRKITGERRPDLIKKD